MKRFRADVFFAAMSIILAFAAIFAGGVIQHHEKTMSAYKAQRNAFCAEVSGIGNLNCSVSGNGDLVLRRRDSVGWSYLSYVGEDGSVTKSNSLIRSGKAGEESVEIR